MGKQPKTFVVTISQAIRGLAVVALLLTVVSSDAERTDPLVAEVQKLEKRWDGLVYDTKSSLYFQLTGAHPIVVQSRKNPAVVAFLADLAKTQARIESESFKRSGAPIGHPSLKSFAQAATQYFALQTRVAYNDFKLFHQPGAKRELPDFQKFNLRISQKSSIELWTNPTYAKRFQLRHTPDPKTGEYRVELFLNPEDLRNLEFLAISDPKSETDFAKLIQFVTIRESMVNRWASRRIYSLRWDDKPITHCGSEFYAFRQRPNSPITQSESYRSLWAEDLYLEFNDSLNDLVKISLGRNLLDLPQSADLVREFFTYFPEFSSEILVTSDPVAIDAYFDQTAAPALIAVDNESWQLVADKTILDWNYAGDDLSPDAIAERIAEGSFETRKRFLVDQLISFAQSTVDDYGNPRFHAITTNRSAVLAHAVALVDRATSPQAKTWKARLRADVIRYLNSHQALALRTKRSEDRLDQMVEDTLEQAELGVRAETILAAYQKDEKRIRDAKFSQSYRYSGPFAPPPSRSVSPDLRIESLLYQTPSESYGEPLKIESGEYLLRFFFDKAQKIASFNEPSAISKRMEETISDPALVHSLKSLFATTSEHFSADPDAKTHPEDALGRALRASVGPVLVKFIQATESLPKAADQEMDQKPSNTRLVRPAIAVAPSDQTFVARRPRPRLEGESPPAYRATETERIDQLVRFVEAISLIGISIDPSKSSHPLIKSPAYAQAWAKSPFRALQDKSPGKFPKRFSVFDQAILADIVRDVALTKQPILGVREKNDEDSPTTLQRLAKSVSLSVKKGYEPLDRKKLKDSIWEATGFAMRSDNSKVETACLGNPLDPDHNLAFQQTYRSATHLREQFAKTNQLKSWDESLRSRTRSSSQKFLEDYVDPISMGLFVAMMIIAGWTMVPLALSAGFSLFSGTVGLSAIFANIGAAVSASGGLAGFLIAQLSGNALWLNLLFSVQTISMLNVYCFKLPPQMQYQFDVANSHIGYFAESVGDRKSVDRMRDEIHTMRNMAIFGAVADAAGHAAFTVPYIMEKIGVRGQLKLARLADRTGENLAQEISAPRLQDFIREHGLRNGITKYARSAAQSLKEADRLRAVSAQVSASELKEILIKKLATELYDLKSLDLLYQARIDALGVEATQLMQASRAAAVADQLKSKSFLDWFEQSVMSHFRTYDVGGQYYEMYVARDLVEAMVDGKLYPGIHSQNEIRAFILNEKARNVHLARLNLAFTRQAIAQAIQTGGENAAYRFFQSMNEDALLGQEETFRWFHRQINGGKLKRFVLGSQEPTWRSVLNAYSDYQYLRGDLSKTVSARAAGLVMMDRYGQTERAKNHEAARTGEYERLLISVNPN